MEAILYWATHPVHLSQTASDQELGKEGNANPQEPPKNDLPSVSSSAGNEIRSIRAVRTLEDCLIFFSLPEVLDDLDGSLEKVKKFQESKEAHEAYWKDIDKKLLKKSIQYHPDRVSNRGGKPVELFEAQKAQSALNTTRTVLSILNQEFLQDLDIDHKYKFYAKLKLNSLGNEEEIKKHIKHVLHKTIWLSEIKQVHIIAQIRMFLAESQLSLQSYCQGDLSQFKMQRDDAFYHLKKCVEGYEKLLKEFKIISEECRKEKLDHIGSVIRKMEIKSLTETQTLKSLIDVTKLSLTGKFQVFSGGANIDEYLVLPFVYYVNAMLMCSLMHSKKHENPFSVLSFRNTSNKHIPLCGKSTLETLFNVLTRLAYKLYEEYHTKPSKILNEKNFAVEEIRILFDKHMKDFHEELGNRYKTQAYVEGGNKNFISKQYSNFMKVAKGIDKEVVNMLQDFKNCKTINEEIQKKYDHAMKLSWGLKKNTEESLEQSRVLHEEVSKAFLKSPPEIREKEVSFVNGSDDMERYIAECLEQSKLMHEEVSNVLKKTQKTIEIGLNCEKIVQKLHFLERKQRNFPPEQNSPATFIENKEAENNEKRNVDEDLFSSNDFVGGTLPTEVRYSMAESVKNLSHHVKKQKINFVATSIKSDSKTEECCGEHVSFQGQLRPEYIMTRKPNERLLNSFDVVENIDNKKKKLLEGTEYLEKESLIGALSTNQDIEDGSLSFTEIYLEHVNKEEKQLGKDKQNYFSAGKSCEQTLNGYSMDFVENATEITNEIAKDLKESQTMDRKFVDGKKRSAMLYVAPIEENSLSGQDKPQTLMGESMEIEGNTEECNDKKNPIDGKFHTKHASRTKPDEERKLLKEVPHLRNESFMKGKSENGPMHHEDTTSFLGQVQEKIAVK